MMKAKTIGIILGIFGMMVQREITGIITEVKIEMVMVLVINLLEYFLILLVLKTGIL